MSDFIGFDVQGNKRIAAALAEMPDEVADVAVDDLSEYLINVYQIYPSYKHITRREGFPNLSFQWRRKDGRFGKVIRGYKSQKQFKYVMWLKSTGQLPYHRTQKLRNAWKQIDKGRDSIIVNETDYAGFVMGDSQTHMHDLIGWNTPEEIMNTRRDRIDKILYSSARKALKKLGLLK